MKRLLCFFAIFLLIGRVCAAEMPGLKVGDPAPGFVLKSAAGEDVTLSVLLEKGPVALVFVRSAD